jgi:hypothetical protein
MKLCLCGCGEAVKKGNRYIWRHNTPLIGPARRKALNHIPPIRDQETGCLLYQGHIQVNGYGKIGNRGAHRVAYEEVYGPIPASYVIDHVWDRGCRYKHCIEPTHLEAVTTAENLRRERARRLTNTHCKDGHAYEDMPGRRSCRTCINIRRRSNYQKARTSEASRQQMSLSAESSPQVPSDATGR